MNKVYGEQFSQYLADLEAGYMHQLLSQVDADVSLNKIVIRSHKKLFKKLQLNEEQRVINAFELKKSEFGEIANVGDENDKTEIDGDIFHISEKTLLAKCDLSFKWRKSYRR
jgi:hypothetical protein